jgi:hypothetical protein
MSRKWHRGPQDLADNQVFVFGSNRKGIHGAGAALWARKWRGALQGISEGLLPDEKRPGCYALPTKWTPWTKMALSEVEQAIARFTTLARARPDLDFFVTRVGCGLAGFEDKDIAPRFTRGAPENCTLWEGWRKY